MEKTQGVVTIFLLVVVVFALGVVFGNSWNSADASEAGKLLQSSELDAESFRVEQELFNSFESNCDLAKTRLGVLSNDLARLGKVLGAKNAREQLGSEYDFHKKKFHLMQIRTYILEKKLSSDCAGSGNVILYYFSQDDPASEEEGTVLDLLVAEYPLHVFAIEYNYAKELKFLEEYYQVNNTPTLVVNFKEVLSGPVSKEQLVPLLHG
ncbi:MAG TPA: hypothetical protein VJJ82_04925 [Candidatus Nanoarchaeia archaeon]|nr:hypothetical protein [Candidatus Nanoarchaeia archaeon]